MSTAQWAWMAVAVVLVFWMVGGYNRVVALRTRIGEAVAQLDDGMRQRSEAAAPLVATLRTPLAGEQGALDTLAAATQAAATALVALRQKPASREAAAAYQRAEGAWAAAASRVRALVELHPALASDEAVAPSLKAQVQGDERIAFARRLFNEAAAAYDEAVRQFPTSLLAWLFGLKAAGRL